MKRQLILLCGLFLLGSGPGLQISAEEAAPEWEGSLRMYGESLEVVVAPQTGRMVHLSAPGGENLLTFNEELVGTEVPAEEGDWLNYGGDWLWPVHQSDWPKLGGGTWPPPRLLDHGGWHGDQSTDEDGTQRIRLRRDIGSPVYVEVVRELVLPSGPDADLKVHQSIRRIQASDIPVCLWQISQLRAADRVGFDWDPQAFYNQGYRVAAFDSPGEHLLVACPEGLVYRAGVEGEHKLGTTGYWIAGTRSSRGLLIWAEGGRTGGAYPDGGCPVVMYSNTGLGYSEIETQSHIVELAPGEVLSNTVTYRLLDLPGDLSECEWLGRIAEQAPNLEVASFDPDPATPEDVITLRVRTDESGGMVHWGVNGPDGNWELPAEVYWPEGTAAGRTGVAADTPLPDPVDGVSELKLGPFNDPAQVVNSLHAALRWGDRWESRGGENFNLEIQSHPDAAEIIWTIETGSDGEIHVELGTEPEADSVQLLENGESVAHTGAGRLETGLHSGAWGFGPQRLQARAVLNGRLSTGERRIWKIPDLDTGETWPEELPYGGSATDDGQWRVHLLAPNARFIEVIWETEDGGNDSALMHPVGEGRWGAVLPVSADSPLAYQYRIDGKHLFADPWSVDVRWETPEGEISHRPEEAWSLLGSLPDALPEWTRPAPETWVVYELSIPDVAPPGSYNGLADKLDYIAGLGVNAIEPLPVTAFPGEISWGYNPAFHKAIERSYGTPEELRNLFLASRERGIAFIKDLVLNHVDGSGPMNLMHGEAEINPFLTPFDGFNWGFPKLDQESPDFQRYTRDVLEHWVNFWGVDGFRYDATQWIKWSGYNDWGASWMSYVVHRTDPGVVQIAENLPSEPRMVRGTELDNEWDGHYRWRMRKILSDARITEPEKMAEILDPRNHAYDSGWQRMPYIESHDEERFVRELLEKGFSEHDAFMRHHAAVAVTLTVPGMPMLYAGQEWGEKTRKVVGPNPLQWDLREEPARARLLEKFRALIHLRTGHRALHHDRIDLLEVDSERGVVAYKRPGVPESIVVAFNVSREPQTVDLARAGNFAAELHHPDPPPSPDAIELAPGQARIFRVLDH